MVKDTLIYVKSIGEPTKQNIKVATKEISEKSSAATKHLNEQRTASPKKFNEQRKESTKKLNEKRLATNKMFTSQSKEGHKICSYGMDFIEDNGPLDDDKNKKIFQYSDDKYEKPMFQCSCTVKNHFFMKGYIPSTKGYKTF